MPDVEGKEDPHKNEAGSSKYKGVPNDGKAINLHNNAEGFHKQPDRHGNPRGTLNPRKKQRIVGNLGNLHTQSQPLKGHKNEFHTKSTPL